MIRATSSTPLMMSRPRILTLLASLRMLLVSKTEMIFSLLMLRVGFISSTMT
ncbi:hypothetical protein D3C73_1649940 [compost metagenome]